MKPDDFAELHAFLNEEAESASRRRPHRLPEHAYAVPGALYCVTLCSRRHGTPFEVPELARGVIRALLCYRDRGNYLIRAYCIMPDHLHAVLELCPPRPRQNIVPIVELMARLKRYTTTQLAWKQRLEGGLWQRDFYDHIGRTAGDIENQILYVLDRPVRRGLAQHWRDWPYSGEPDPWNDDGRNDS